MKKSILTSSLSLALLSSGYGAIAYSTSLIDVADFKPTFGDSAFGAPTSRGNDGSTAVGNWTHADFPTSATPYPGQATNAPNPYWEVDLQGSFDLNNIVVTDRVDCCDPNRLNGSTVTLFGAGGSVVGTESIAGIANGTFGSIFDFNNGGLGYLGVERVRIDGAASNQYFQFAEFDAMAFAPVNWALGVSAQFYDAAGGAFGSWPGSPASNATDGNFNTFTHPANPTPHNDYYLEVDLGQDVWIDSITMTGRLASACCDDRLVDYDLQFLDSSGSVIGTINHAGGTKATETIDVIGVIPGSGLGPQARYVRVINANDTNYGPQVGEIQVFGVIPEPSTALLAGLGLCALLRRRRR